MRKNMTPWERKLWFQFLQKHKFRFQRQYVIGNYIVDFYCYRANLVIELDGSGHYQSKQTSYDKRRTEELTMRGLTVQRFSNYDITSNFEGVCLRINQLVDAAIAHPPPQAVPLPPAGG